MASDGLVFDGHYIRRDFPDRLPGQHGQFPHRGFSSHKQRRDLMGGEIVFHLFPGRAGLES